MTRKEVILEILEKQDKPISSREITDIIYSDYSFIVDIKRQYYVDKGLIKNEKDVFNQLNAETSKYIIDEINDFIVSGKINKKKHVILKSKYVDGMFDNDIIEKEEDPLEKIREKKKEIIKVEVEREIIYQMTCEELDWKCLTIYKDDGHLDYEITKIKEYTYIFDGNNKLIKIGKTSQETPINRLNGLKTANPAINVAIVFPSTLYKEKYLHNKYDIYREQDNREWFFKSKELISFVDDHTKKNKIALDWYHEQKKIKEIEKNILSW